MAVKEVGLLKQDNTRDKILSAARNVFSKYGYTRATTKEIANVAGVAEITLFRHFETKINLFYETISKYLINTMLDSKPIESNVDAKQTILKLTQERIDTLRDNKDLFICTLYEAQFNDEVKGMLKKIHSKVFDVLTLYLESNQILINDIKIEYIAQLFLSTIVGTIVFETIGGSKDFADSKKLIDTIKTLISN